MIQGHENVPKSTVIGIKYKSICFDPPKYLLYLFGQAQKLGARIIKASVDTSSGLNSIMRSAKVLLTTEGVKEEVFAFVNCTGLIARHFLVREEAEKLYLIRW